MKNESEIERLERMVENGFTEMRTQFTDLRNETKADFAAVNKRIDLLDQKIDRIDAKLDQHRQETKDGFAGVHRLIGGMSATLSDHEERLKALDGE